MTFRMRHKGVPHSVSGAVGLCPQPSVLPRSGRRQAADKDGVAAEELCEWRGPGTWDPGG